MAEYCLGLTAAHQAPAVAAAQSASCTRHASLPAIGEALCQQQCAHPVAGAQRLAGTWLWAAAALGLSSGVSGGEARAASLAPEPDRPAPSPAAQPASPGVGRVCKQHLEPRPLPIVQRHLMQVFYRQCS